MDISLFKYLRALVQSDFKFTHGKIAQETISVCSDDKFRQSELVVTCHACQVENEDEFFLS